eukprot:1241919-Pyramimonas_sp.AAC.1
MSRGSPMWARAAQGCQGEPLWLPAEASQRCPCHPWTASRTRGGRAGARRGAWEFRVQGPLWTERALAAIPQSPRAPGGGSLGRARSELAFPPQTTR